MKPSYQTNALLNGKDSNISEKTRAVFYTPTGWLSIYSLACGYMESVEIDDDNRASLEMDGCFHVRGFVGGVHFWDTFDTVSGARGALIRRVRSMQGAADLAVAA